MKQLLIAFLAQERHNSVELAQGNANQQGAKRIGANEREVMWETSSLSHSARAATSAQAGEARAQFETEKVELTISQMSRRYNVTHRTLRFYEDRGLLTPHREGNARIYRAADQVRFEMILRGKKLGFTLTEIINLIGGRGATEDGVDDGAEIAVIPDAAKRRRRERVDNR